jgi:RNA polymerase sigma-70 factor (ECF subfamily)
MIDVTAMHRCLVGLDVRARSVLHLSFIREKPVDDIARALETTPGNVRVLRHRALAQLRRCLDGETEVAS